MSSRGKVGPNLTATPKASSTVRLRRSPCVISYWGKDGRLVYHNYLTKTRINAAPILTTILDFFTDWKQPSELQASLPRFSAFSIASTVRRLVAKSFLEVESFVDPRSEAMRTWSDWSPAADFFHFSTKDVKFLIQPKLDDQEVRKYIRSHPQPSFFKRYPDSAKFDLPSECTSIDGEFLTVLQSRRTWREFAPEKLRVEDLAQLLSLTWGVRKYMKVRFLGNVPLKTSPSAGARNPVEVYVAALRVQGLKRGLYHYCSDTHQLEVAGEMPNKPKVIRYLGGQWWYGNAAAVFIMTAVFSRSMWKYTYPRSYRSILLDAGHLCQTLCLTATWLGLAPFCTAALADSVIERDLGLDGITESVIYAAGVGVRP
jgi:SagB-type dehydrogenase family enzyme